jgi:hypothetical protein
MRVCEGSKAAQSDVRTIRTVRRCTVGKTNTYVDRCLSVYSSHGHPISHSSITSHHLKTVTPSQTTTSRRSPPYILSFASVEVCKSLLRPSRANDHPGSRDIIDNVKAKIKKVSLLISNICRTLSDHNIQNVAAFQSPRLVPSYVWALGVFLFLLGIKIWEAWRDGWIELEHIYYVLCSLSTSFQRWDLLPTTYCSLLKYIPSFILFLMSPLPSKFRLSILVGKYDCGISIVLLKWQLGCTSHPDCHLL